MPLDFTSLQKALGSLGRAIKRSQGSPGDEELRDVVIHRFEFTYELALKTLKRKLKQEALDPSQIDQLSFRDLLREASQHGYPVDFKHWMEFRSRRNITSHTYDDKKASEVYDAAVDFYEDAKALFKTLEDRNRD